MMRYRLTVYSYYTKTIVLCSSFALLNTKTHINYFQLWQTIDQTKCMFQHPNKYCSK